MLARALFQIPRLIRDSRRIKAGKSVAPRLLTYTVTFRCNARCIMCDSWKLKGHHDLEIEEIESIFRQLPRLDAVRLTGGEPFVRTDLLEIVELVVRYLRPFGIHITSNGFLTDRIIELCEKRSRVVPLQIMISMDGLAEQHNHIRGNKNAFGCAMKTIESLIPLRRKLNLDLVVNQTIVDAEGMEQYKALHDKAPSGDGLRCKCDLCIGERQGFGSETSWPVYYVWSFLPRDVRRLFYEDSTRFAK